MNPQALSPADEPHREPPATITLYPTGITRTQQAVYWPYWFPLPPFTAIAAGFAFFVADGTTATIVGVLLTVVTILGVRRGWRIRLETTPTHTRIVNPSRTVTFTHDTHITATLTTEYYNAYYDVPAIRLASPTRQGVIIVASETLGKSSPERERLWWETVNRITEVTGGSNLVPKSWTTLTADEIQQIDQRDITP